MYILNIVFLYIHYTIYLYMLSIGEFENLLIACDIIYKYGIHLTPLLDIYETFKISPDKVIELNNNILQQQQQQQGTINRVIGSEPEKGTGPEPENGGQNVLIIGGKKIEGLDYAGKILYVYICIV